MPNPTPSSQQPSYQDLQAQVEQLSLEKAELERTCEEIRRKGSARILELERLLITIGYKPPTEAQKAQALVGLPLFEGQFCPASSEGAAEVESVQEETITYRRRKRGTGNRGRKGLPESLERQVKEYPVNTEELEGYDSEQGHRVVDFDLSEELKYVPPRFYVLVHKRPVVAFTKQDGEVCLATVGQASKVFDKCMASPEILAKIAVDRLDLALTLYRIERWFSDLGCPVSRGTLCYWMRWLGQLLEPLDRERMVVIKRGFKIHADDTTTQVLDPGAGTTRSVRTWVLIGGDCQHPEIVFRTTASRDYEAAWELFGDYEGYLQVDACGVYNSLFADGKRKEVGCWSHCYRKFEDLKSVDGRVVPMLKKIRRLCDIEEQAKDLEPQERCAARSRDAAPVLEEIRKWTEEKRKEEVLETGFKKALNYIVNQWAPLTRYLEDGRLSLDNNISEGEFHIFGITRRNHLFWGEDGLKDGLVVLGLIRTCRVNGINPYEYLKDVIERIRDGEEPARELIPTRWKPRQVESLVQPAPG